MFKKIAIGTTIVLCTSMLTASEKEASIFNGKRIAIKYEAGKSPKDYFDKVFEISKEFVASGDILSSEISTDEKYKDMIRFLVKTDSISGAMNERNALMTNISNRYAEQNIPITGILPSFPENKFFGDKRIGYIVNRHESCFYEDFLTKGFKQLGAEIVSPDQDPDITMTIGVDACLTDWELAHYLASKKQHTDVTLKSINRLAGVPNEIQKPISNAGSTLSSDLMRSGSSTNLALGSNDKVGIAMMGIGATIGLLSKFSGGDEPIKDIDIGYGKELDLIRYHVTLEGKGQERVSYYSVYTGLTQHAHIQPIAVDAFVYPERMLYLYMKNWIHNSKVMKESLLPYQKEPDLYKSIKMLTLGENYAEEVKPSENLIKNTDPVVLMKPETPTKKSNQKIKKNKS